MENQETILRRIEEMVKDEFLKGSIFWYKIDS